MKGALLGFALVALTAVSASAIQQAEADESATANGAVSPTPTYPPLSSTITVRFVEQGAAVEVQLFALLPAITADGVSCVTASPSIGTKVDHMEIKWPLTRITSGQPPECMGGPPTQIGLQFATYTGYLNGTVIWQGSDTTLDLDIENTVPYSSPRPAAVPDTGGSPSRDGSYEAAIWQALGLIGLGVGAFGLACGLRVGKRK